MARYILSITEPLNALAALSKANVVGHAECHALIHAYGQSAEHATTTLDIFRHVLGFEGVSVFNFPTHTAGSLPRLSSLVFPVEAAGYADAKGISTVIADSSGSEYFSEAQIQSFISQLQGMISALLVAGSGPPINLAAPLIGMSATEIEVSATGYLENHYRILLYTVHDGGTSPLVSGSGELAIETLATSLGVSMVGNWRDTIPAIVSAKVASIKGVWSGE